MTKQLSWVYSGYKFSNGEVNIMKNLEIREGKMRKIDNTAIEQGVGYYTTTNATLTGYTQIHCWLTEEGWFQSHPTDPKGGDIGVSSDVDIRGYTEVI